jgi:hypothetical protein
MRLLAHTDLDGLMCAVLLIDAEEVDEVKFIDPATIQSGKMPIFKHDIIADLPYDKRCGMWFDHHESSRPPAERKFEGSWKLAPSAARVVFDYYENPYLGKYRVALDETDRVDSGQVLLEEVRKPAGWFLFSNILEMEPDKAKDDEFRRHAIWLVRKNPDITAVLADSQVAERCERLKKEFAKFEEILEECTVMVGKVAFSDLRRKSGLPRGSNYLVYALFPGAITSARLMPEQEEKGTVKLSVGHNVFGKEKSGFDVGAAMKRLGGGGHRAVGGARLMADEAEAAAKKIIEEINDFEKSAT